MHIRSIFFPFPALTSFYVTDPRPVAGYDPAIPVWRTGMFPITPHRRVAASQSACLCRFCLSCSRLIISIRICRAYPPNGIKKAGLSSFRQSLLVLYLYLLTLLGHTIWSYSRDCPCKAYTALGGVLRAQIEFCRARQRIQKGIINRHTMPVCSLNAHHPVFR